MSNTKNTGGAAFPAMGEHNTPKGPNYVWNEGMDLRDYFAAKAMQGMIHRMNGEERWYALQGGLANEAYEVADAMLKAREQ